MARANSNFIPLPDLPTGTSPELAALMERIRVAYISDEDEITDDWFPAKREVAAFASRNSADIAVKLMAALHEIGPGRDGDRIGYHPDDFCTDLSMELIVSAMNDAAAAIKPDPVAAAWQRFATRHWQEALGKELPADEQSRADERLLSEAVASTPRGIAGKLRYALFCGAPDRWVEAVALGAEVPGLPDLLYTADASVQSILTAIQSLEAMEARP